MAIQTIESGVVINRAALRSGILGAFLLLVSVSTAEAGMMLWQWEGPVTGYSGNCVGSGCGLPLATVVPLGTMIRVSLSIDPDAGSPVPDLPCYRGTASASLEVLGNTYSGRGHVWDEAHGFGGGNCVPGFNFIEVVAPSWGSGGPALGGWVTHVDFSFLPGLWWAGDLTYAQPRSISTQFPKFVKVGESAPQRFIADLQAVPEDLTPAPEPTTWILFGTGLATAAWRRRRSGSK